MADAGVQAAAMEVSSHGLALHRVDGTRFKAAIFTNLTQDHLDFHADLDDYYLAKRRLFTPVHAAGGRQPRRPPRAPAGRTAEVATVTTGTAADADWRHRRHRLPGGDQLPAALAGRVRPVRLRLAGQFNAVNALGALAAADAIGIDLDTAVAGLEALAGVPGRFERVDAGQPFTVLVDYAHTPDSSTTCSGRPGVTGGRVIVVFGCGGDRDRAKRAHGRDRRPPGRRGRGHLRQPSLRGPGGDRRQVAEGVAAGAGPDGYLVEVDRRAAIRAALAMAGPGDAVLVAGKGHEQGQEFAGGRKVPFDDRQVAAEELAGPPGRAPVLPGHPQKEVAEATGGGWPAPTRTRSSPGSRSTPGSSAGELFVALPGSRTDGSLFAAAAAEAGRPPPWPRRARSSPGPGSRSPTPWPPWPPWARPSGTGRRPRWSRSPGPTARPRPRTCSPPPWPPA